MSAAILNIADDNGYFNHKTAFFNRKGAIETAKYRTMIGTAQESKTDQGGKPQGLYETEEGARFSCHDTIQNPIALRSQDYGSSAENRVLVNHGLSNAGSDGNKVRLTTSLPFNHYFRSDGARNEDLINAQAENMRQPVYQALVDGRKDTPIANVIDSQVMCEGVAALMDFIIDDAGNPRFEEDDLQAPMAVLDFGGSTFDVVAVSPDFGILQAHSDSLGRGTLDVREKLADSLTSFMKEKGLGNDPAHYMIDRALTTDKLKVFKGGEAKEYDVRELRRAAAKPVVQELKSFAKSQLGDPANYQFILLVGGGALACQDLFEDWAEQYNLVVRDEFANARGMLKNATYLLG